MEILDETNEFLERREGLRPPFLTVLCILTWVGCGFGIITGLIQLWSYSLVNSINGIQGSTGRSVAFMFWSAIATLLGSFICLFAAIMMFKQKKVGFFIYIFGQVLPILAGFYSALIVTNGIGIGAGLSVIMTLVGMIIPVAFIIMYGVNLKHMNK